MADCLPIASSGPREPVKRVRPIPKVVREACLLLVYGDPDDEDGVPVDLVAAAKAIGMRANTLRRYLHRPQVIAFLRAERRAFREALLAGNEGALKRVRDSSPNGMAVIASVRTLENMDVADDGARTGHPQQTPGITINILPATPPPIDITSKTNTPQIEHGKE